MQKFTAGGGGLEKRITANIGGRENKNSAEIANVICEVIIIIQFAI